MYDVETMPWKISKIKFVIRSSFDQDILVRQGENIVMWKVCTIDDHNFSIQMVYEKF